MITPSTTFRLEKKVIKMMDRLITNPPPVTVDPDFGKPRNRTELIANLVRKAVGELEKVKEAASEQA